MAKATQSKLIPNLKRVAAGWAGQLTILAKSFAPNHLKPYISSHVEDDGKGRFRIRLIADRKAAPLPKYGSLDARAQEYGSGLRARRGPKRKYPIVPKNAQFLEFVGTNEFDGWLIRTTKVSHPGIEAANDGKGYMAPAIKELKKHAKEKLSKEVREAIMSDLRTSFSNAKRK